MDKVIKYWSSLGSYKILLIVLLAAVVLNIVLFAHGGQGNFKALRFNQGTDIIDTDHLMGRYGPFVFMRDHSSQATLYIPDISGDKRVDVKRRGAFMQRAVGIARLDDVKVRKYSQDLIVQYMKDKQTSLSGRYNDEVKRNWKIDNFKVYVSDNSVDEWIYVRDGTTDMFIDISIIDHDLLKGLHG